MRVQPGWELLQMFLVLYVGRICMRFRVRRQIRESESPKPAPGRTELAAASSPDPAPTGARSGPARPSPALPAAAFAKPQPGWATVPLTASATAGREIPSPPPVWLRNRRTGPRAAPVRGGHHRAVRHKHEA